MILPFARYLMFSELRATLGSGADKGKTMKLISKFWRDESGATAIEYGLIAAGISIAIIVAVNGLGTNLNNMFTSVNNSLK
jgi:pilus assembly protein Flp/PilA